MSLCKQVTIINKLIETYYKKNAQQAIRNDPPPIKKLGVLRDIIIHKYRIDLFLV